MSSDRPQPMFINEIDLKRLLKSIDDFQGKLDRIMEAQHSLDLRLSRFEEGLQRFQHDLEEGLDADASLSQRIHNLEKRWFSVDLLLKVFLGAIGAGATMISSVWMASRLLGF
jgi:hypothetical protein